MGLSAGSQSRVKCDQGLVPAEGCRQRCSEHGAAQTAPAACDVALAFVFAAVVVEGSQPGKSRSFFAADLSELGHTNDQRQRGAFTDAGDAQYQFQAAGKIGVAAKMLSNGAYLRCPSRLQPSDIAADNAPQVRLVDMLKPGLEARDVFFNLLKEGKISGQFRQSGIWYDPRLIECGRAGCDQNRIEHVVFGPAQMHPSKRLDLHRLQHKHSQTSRAQILHRAAFITTGSLDPDARHASLSQTGGKGTPAR